MIAIIAGEKETAQLSQGTGSIAGLIVICGRKIRMNQKAKIIEMLRQHVSQKDISHRLGVSRRYVHRVLLELREKGEAL
ncbi:MAG: helix-turn-helix domain-containing protein [Marvinbryantia sp.]|uniref:helix-turn-helix domain-containing protein n=1 Tax=Marvinbryantia sp. TaxID=2496532 RepID=UPI00399ADC2B